MFTRIERDENNRKREREREKDKRRQLKGAIRERRLGIIGAIFFLGEECDVFFNSARVLTRARDGEIGRFNFNRARDAACHCLRE